MQEIEPGLIDQRMANLADVEKLIEQAETLTRTRRAAQTRRAAKMRGVAGPCCRSPTR